MSITAQKYLVAFLSLALFAALLVVGKVDSERRAPLRETQKEAAAAMLNPQLQRGHAVFIRYSCNACHGAKGEGGIKNLNAESGGEINGLKKVNETYTPQELEEKIRNGVAEVGKADPTGPDPPLKMPAYRKLIDGQEMQDLVAYLLSLAPRETRAKSSAW